MNRSKIKARIEEEIQSTIQTISLYEEMTKPVAPDVAIGRVSRMDAINNNAVTESALRQSKLKLSQLEYVLQNIDNKDFGICRNCKAPIPIERIIIKPESSFCVRCAK